ncbi:MAG TPA: RDD family protein [Gammaproteobacteria bacterium]
MSARVHSPYIGFVRRCAATLLDLLLLAFLSSVFGWLLMLEYPDAEAIMRSAGIVFMPLIPLLIVLLWWRLQGTPGKLLLGCRIVDARSGGHPQLWQALVRLLGYALSALPLGLGFLWMIRDTRHQAWHDKLARTLVVEDDDSRLTLRQLAEA